MVSRGYPCGLGPKRQIKQLDRLNPFKPLRTIYGVELNVIK